MKNYNLSLENFPEFIELIQGELSESKIISVSTAGGSTGKWGMARLWRAWMDSTGKFMAGNGSKMPLMIGKDGNPWGEREFNRDDAHALFTAHWLGEDNQGNRLSWSRKGRDGMRAASKGERFHALRQHEAWAVEKGIILINPRDSEYFGLIEEGGY